jgi:IPT/TIG domain
MRYVALLLASVVMMGCGSGSMSKADPPRMTTVFVPPSITQLSPTSVPVNSVPFVLTVNGTNFNTDAVVFFSGVAQHTVFITSGQLMVSLTATDLQFTGLAPVYVRTLGQNSNTVDFDVTAQ